MQTTHFFQRIHGFLLFFIVFLAKSATAQVLEAENKMSIALKDGTQVVLLGRANTVGSGDAYGSFSGEYYYLPTHLRLSRKKDKDKTPEFLFLKYTSDERADAGGAQGALMHFLMEWGLTPEQTTEAEGILAAKIKDLAKNPGPNNRYKNIKSPKIVGPADLKSDVPESFRIISGTLTNKQFTPNLITTGRAPLLPGSKMAVAAVLDKNGAQLLAATFEKTRSITDVSIDLRFQYEVLTPAVEGKITVRWESIDSMYQKFKRDYQHKDKDDETMPKHNSLKDDIITDSTKEALYQVLRESKAVDIKLDVLKANDPVAQEVTKAFMDYFLSSVSDKEFNKEGEGEKFKAKDYKTDDEYQPPTDLYEYHVNRERLQYKKKTGLETFDLKLRIPVVKEMTITENLASWYDGVKSNKACVGSVNLNDPFFQHRDINVILDLEAEEIMGKEVNYATVNIRKNRKSKEAFDFSKAVTFDRKLLEKEGNRVTVSYSKAQDEDPDVYEYKVQWSLRGGNLFPAKDTSWTKGSWQGITLAPPVKPRTIRFEADRDEMKELGIKNVTLQVRCQKFGQEVENNISINASAAESFTEKMIFMDRNTKGYAYRMVFHHKELGPVATEWEAKINTDYAYATIPVELRDKNPDWIKKAKEAASIMISTDASGNISKEQQILDKFAKVLDVVTEKK
jgi:hypothetical protein